jgi:hypothetical protein
MRAPVLAVFILEIAVEANVGANSFALAKAMPCTE